MKPKMSIREYFAIEAMKGILSNASVVMGINYMDVPKITVTAALLADELICALRANEKYMIRDGQPYGKDSPKKNK